MPSRLAGSAGRDDVLTIGAYSVVREAFHEGLLPLRRASGRSETGRTVRFEESYNGSGAQSRAIASGFDADIAILSLESDVHAAGQGGAGQEGAGTRARTGASSRGAWSSSASGTGNPKRSTTGTTWPGPAWACSIPIRRPPAGPAGTSTRSTAPGCSATEATKPDLDAARDSWRRSRRNVVNMDSSGRQSMATFERGTGDAVVTYENELLLRKKFGARPSPTSIARRRRS